SATSTTSWCWGRWQARRWQCAMSASTSSSEAAWPRPRHTSGQLSWPRRGSPQKRSVLPRRTPKALSTPDAHERNRVPDSSIAFLPVVQPSLRSKARFRCPVGGRDEFDVLFESISDDQFGHDPNSEYKQ